MLRYVRCSVAVAALCALAGLVSCTSTTQQAKSPLNQVGLPSVVSLDMRAVSGISSSTLNGVDTLARSSGAFQVGTSLFLYGSQSAAEWGLYRFTPSLGATAQDVTVVLNDTSTDEAWIGVAEYGSLRWQFSGSFGAQQTVDLTNSNFVSPGGYVYVAVLCTGIHTAQVESLTLTAEGNLPPVASFTATPQSGSPGEPVALDAGGSTDSDGIIVNYEWDLDGDGSFETDGASDPLANATLPDPAGTVEVGLRITDDRGAINATTAQLESSDLSGWQTALIATDGLAPSLESINGIPCVAYYTTTQGLRFSYANSPNGLAGWSAVSIDEQAGWGDAETSLSVAAGKPAISFYNKTLGCLKYAYSNTTDGSAGWSTVTVDNSGTVGRYSSLALVAGKPAISYWKDTERDLKYAYCSSLDGSSGWSNLTVDSDGLVGAWTSLAVVNGTPAISYFDASFSSLKYAYSSTSDGSSGWSALTVDGPLTTVRATALGVLASGKPAIAYFSVESGYVLRYAYSDSIDGSSSWNILEVEEKGFSLSACNLALVAGKPAIAYGVDDLRYLTSNVADGSAEWSGEVVTTGAGKSSLAILSNGKPAIAFESGGGIQFAVLL